MMSFDPTALGRIGITAEQIEVMDAAETVCRDTSDMKTVREHIESNPGFNPDVWDKVSALGWLGIAIPEIFGGIGLSLAEVVPVAEQMGRRMMAMPFVPTTLAAQALLSGGTDSQKQTYLKQISEGLMATLALSELNGAFDTSDIETTAMPSSQGYTLRGRKILVQNLDTAKLVIVSARLKGRLALFVIGPEVMAQAHIRREVVIDETKRSYELILDDVHIPETALMELNKTSDTLARIELAGSLLGSAELVGGSQACIAYTVDYLKTRKQFGKLIGSYQALKHTIVDAHIGYEKARSLLYAAAHSFEQQGKGEVATRMAAVSAGRSLSFAADRAIQFHGGFGFTYDCDAQLYRRRAIFQDSLYGNTRWHKKKLAGLLFNSSEV